jgi:hypothetical protein
MDMAAEPEKKIEKLLHDYSRKRREDAGAPLEMHPATRRMLQGEVGRQFKDGGASSASPRPWWKTLLLIGPKYAGALGMFAVLALGVWVISQQDRTATRVGDVATRQPAAPDANASRPLGESAKREAETFSELDNIRVVQEEEKSSLNKKGQASTGGERLEDQVKLQMRGAENRPAPTAAPATPELKTVEQLGREKQMVLEDQAQAGRRIAAVVTGGVLSADKSTAVAGDALAKDADRFYKLNEGKADTLGVAAASAQPITARLDLAASKPADSTYAYSVIVPATTNVTFGGDTKTFYAGAKFAAATNAAGELLSFAEGLVLANEWAGVAIEPAKNEVARARAVQPLGGVAQQPEWYESGTPALLRKFSVEQSDGRIRIRDAEDGSVYDGEVLAASESNVDAKAKEVHDEVRQLRRNVADGGAPVTFRARGINQRSQQMVIINGVLTEEQERVAAIAGKPIAEATDDPATAVPAPTLPAEVPLRRSEQITSDRAARVQTVTGQTTQAPSQSAAGAPGFVRSNPVFRATTLRARVQIGATNELNFRAIRTR